MEIDKNLEKQVVKETPESFSKRVEDLTWAEDLQYFEALVKIMNDEDLEAEIINKLLTPTLKAKLEFELEEVALLKKKNRLI